MNISDLQPGQGSVNIQLTIASVEEPRVINKYGKDLKLANAIATDGKEEIKLTLWNEDVDKVKTGSIVKIENGYVSEFQGEKQLTSGKFGKLDVVDGSSEPAPAGVPTKEGAEETENTEESASEQTVDEEVQDY